jgi:leader peptidase (prepilin peptidase)/N-methyltransferase
VETEDLVLYIPFAAVLLLVAVIDLERRVIPNRVLLPAALYAAAVAAVTDLDSLPERLLAAAAAGGLLLVLALIRPEGMGMGDVKLAAVMGLYLESAVAVALALAILVGAAVGLLLIARHGSGARKRALAFGPFLAGGGLIALPAGDTIIDWYLGLAL